MIRLKNSKLAGGARENVGMLSIKRSEYTKNPLKA